MEAHHAQSGIYRHFVYLPQPQGSFVQSQAQVCVHRRTGMASCMHVGLDGAVAAAGSSAGLWRFWHTFVYVCCSLFFFVCVCVSGMCWCSFVVRLLFGSFFPPPPSCSHGAQLTRRQAEPQHTERGGCQRHPLRPVAVHRLNGRAAQRAATPMLARLCVPETLPPRGRPRACMMRPWLPFCLCLSLSRCVSVSLLIDVLDVIPPTLFS
jgi:hypothetical protein